MFEGQLEKGNRISVQSNLDYTKIVYQNLLDIFSHKFISCLPAKKKLNIFIPGCGTCTEVKPLIDLLKKKEIQSSFIGIDINAMAVDLAKTKKGIPEGYEYQVMHGDASNIMELKGLGLAPNSFDIAILRNFSIFNGFDQFSDILTKVFFEFLVDNAIIFISCAYPHEQLLLDKLFKELEGLIPESKYTNPNPLPLPRTQPKDNPNAPDYIPDYYSLIVQFKKDTLLIAKLSQRLQDIKTDYNNKKIQNEQEASGLLNTTGVLQTSLEIFTKTQPPIKNESVTNTDSFNMYQSDEKDILEKTEKLKMFTSVFFNNPKSKEQWKTHPEPKGKYKGHTVLFFTMKINEIQQAKNFCEGLQKVGFAVELRETKNSQPSLVADLTTSTLIMNQ